MQLGFTFFLKHIKLFLVKLQHFKKKSFIQVKIAILQVQSGNLTTNVYTNNFTRNKFTEIKKQLNFYNCLHKHQTTRQHGNNENKNFRHSLESSKPY